MSKVVIIVSAAVVVTAGVMSFLGSLTAGSIFLAPFTTIREAFAPSN